MDIIPGQTLPKFFDSFNQQLSIDNPIILILLTIIIIIYYLVFKYLGLGTPTEQFWSFSYDGWTGSKFWGDYNTRREQRFKSLRL